MLDYTLADIQKLIDEDSCPFVPTLISYDYGVIPCPYCGSYVSAGQMHPRASQAPTLEQLEGLASGTIRADIIAEYIDPNWLGVTVR